MALRFASVADRVNDHEYLSPKRRERSVDTHAASAVGIIVVAPPSVASRVCTALTVAGGEWPAMAPVSPRQKSTYFKPSAAATTRDNHVRAHPHTGTHKPTREHTDIPTQAQTHRHIHTVAHTGTHRHTHTRMPRHTSVRKRNFQRRQKHGWHQHWARELHALARIRTHVLHSVAMCGLEMHGEAAEPLPHPRLPRAQHTGEVTPNGNASKRCHAKRRRSSHDTVTPFTVADKSVEHVSYHWYTADEVLALGEQAQ